eukprot:6188092-Prymnesium_polylepis.1
MEPHRAGFEALSPRRRAPLRWRSDQTQRVESQSETKHTSRGPAAGRADQKRQRRPECVGAHRGTPGGAAATAASG